MNKKKIKYENLYIISEGVGVRGTPNRRAITNLSYILDFLNALKTKKGYRHKKKKEMKLTLCNSNSEYDSILSIPFATNLTMNVQ